MVLTMWIPWETYRKHRRRPSGAGSDHARRPGSGR